MAIDWNKYEDLDPMDQWHRSGASYETAPKAKVYISEQEWLETFAGNLQSMMDERGYTQSSLAQAIGTDQSTVSRYLKAERMPSIKNLVNIMIELDARLEDVLDFGSMVF